MGHAFGCRGGRGGGWGQARGRCGSGSIGKYDAVVRVSGDSGPGAGAEGEEPRVEGLRGKEKKEREAAMKLLQAERVEREKVAQTEAREARRRAEVEEENRLREEYIAEQKRLLDEMEAEAEAQGVRDLASTRVGGADPYGQKRAKVLLSLGLKIKGVAMPADGGQKSAQMAGQEDGEI